MQFFYLEAEETALLLPSPSTGLVTEAEEFTGSLSTGGVAVESVVAAVASSGCPVADFLTLPISPPI